MGLFPRGHHGRSAVSSDTGSIPSIKLRPAPTRAEAHNRQGRTYYYDTVTRVTQWAKLECPKQSMWTQQIACTDQHDST